jgi:hypothetical protein
MQRQFENYNFRTWPVPRRPKESDEVTECFKMVNIKPSWPETREEKFNFLSVDGSITRKLAKIIAGFKRDKVVDAIMKKIADDLKEFNLKS